MDEELKGEDLERYRQTSGICPVCGAECFVPCEGGVAHQERVDAARARGRIFIARNVRVHVAGAAKTEA